MPFDVSDSGKERSKTMQCCERRPQRTEFLCWPPISGEQPDDCIGLLIDVRHRLSGTLSLELLELDEHRPFLAQFLDKP